MTVIPRKQVWAYMTVQLGAFLRTLPLALDGLADYESGRQRAPPSIHTVRC